MLLAGPLQALSHRTTLNPTGAAAGDSFGQPVSTAGDVNGDGYADLIIGAPYCDGGGTDAGRAYVYYGGPGADATADLTLTGRAAWDRFGWSVSTAGDVNGDGYADLIVGAPYYDAGGPETGSAYVYYGGPGADAAADLTLTAAAAGDRFGWSVSTAGDVNADGYADLIVGAPQNDAGGTDAGSAYVYYGGPGAADAADLTLTGVAAGDGFGSSVSTAGDVNGDGNADLIVGAPLNAAGGGGAGGAYVYYGGPGADATADLTLTGAAGDRFGWSVSTAGDVNGDGYADLIVGAYVNAAGGTGAGRAYVYYGGPGADATADLTLTGAAAGDYFGFSVSTAGDVNGDGYADLIVGALWNDAGGTDAGRAYVYHGGPGADATADLTLTGAAAGDGFGWSVSTAGDVNADGYADLIVGAPQNDAGGMNAGSAYVIAFYLYQVVSPNGGEEWLTGQAATLRWLGHDVADLSISLDGGMSWSLLASHVGGQEENALAVIAPGVETRFALVRVTSAGAEPTRSTSDASDGVFRIVAPYTPPAVVCRLAMTTTGVAADDWFGWSVSTAGDVNGDGYADLIVGAPQNDAGGTDAGRAYVYYGGPGADATADLTLTGAAAGDRFGWSVSTAGDVNGDGYADLLVGADCNDAGGTDAGSAYVYYGGPGADATADLTLTGEAAGGHFGSPVATAGDVNGDGYSDLIVGGAANAGRAYVYYGAPWADATADLTLTGAGGDIFGSSVSTAGDVNGDGYADLIVGAWANDAGGELAGRAYVYYGGPGADATADLTLTGAAAGDYFGSSVSTAGDVNGDGYGDLIVGADGNDAGGELAGRAYVYYGGPVADATSDLTLTGAMVRGYFGLAVSTAGDVNGDGYADLIVDAAWGAYVYYGGPGADATADLMLTGEAAGERFGWSVSTGDVNGDGYADLIVGAPYNDAGGSYAGRAYVYDVNRYFVLSPNGGETWNVGSLETVSWMGAEPADVSFSVDGGASYQLLRSMVGGSELNSIALRVPHQPTRFALLRITPSNPNLGGHDESDSLFTIDASVTLAAFSVERQEGGVLLTWKTEPGVEALAGFKLEKKGYGEDAWRVLVPLTRETTYRDTESVLGTTYRLSAVNGLGGELVLGEATAAPLEALAAWPLPYRGGRLTVAFATKSGWGGGAGPAELSLYDAHGRLVRRLAHGTYAAGGHFVTWDGKDGAGEQVSSGIYFLRNASGGEVKSLKVVVTR